MRVAVNKTGVKISGGWSWLYAAIDSETKMILDVALFGSNDTDPPAVFLHRLDEKLPLSEDVFLVNQFGYWTAISRLGLSGRVNYTGRNLLEK